MTYQINKTDGSLLVELPDGSLDSDTTSITLIGKNVTGFGEAVNENFIKLLENFASPTKPSNSLIGQTWYDTGTGSLRVFDGSNFSPVSSISLVESAIGLGYGVGAGGVVTQTISKDSPVTLNTPSGRITMNASLLGAGETVGFTLNNSVIDLGDVVIINVTNSAEPGSYNVWAEYVRSGSVSIYLRNISSTALSQPVVLSFAIIKGSVS